MRRGLISWSKDELPETLLDGRVAALQAAMAGAGLDAIVAYTTPARAAAVSWLAGFVPYWNQGLMVVPRQGRPILVSALSNRVNGWMRRNAHVADVMNSPHIGSEAGKFLMSHAGKGNVGVVDLPHLPAVVIEDIAAEGHTIADASALFRAVRVVADPADIALHERAAEIARSALAACDPRERDASRLVSRIDGEARRLGAEEVYPAVAVDLAKSFGMIRLEKAVELGDFSAIRISVAYKGAWVRLTKTMVREDGVRSQIDSAEKAFADLAAKLPDTSALATNATWLVEGTRTALPLEPLAGSMIDDGEPILPGSIVSVSATLDVGGAPIMVGAPFLVGSPTRLLGSSQA